ncbi:MAG TPA: GGDEF domain-containing protein [Pseudomonadales bacterium]
MKEKIMTSAKRVVRLRFRAIFKNPLEWAYIDRTIFLALTSQFLPLIYGSVIAYGLYLQLNFPETAPVALNENIAYWYLGIYAAHYFGLTVFIAAALKIRKTTEEWPLFWYFVAYTWVFSVLIPSFLAGTFYIDGVLMLLLGFTLSLPLQNHRVLMQVYFLASALFLLLALLDLTGTVAHAPLFHKPPYVNGEPWDLWHYARVLMGAGAISYSYVTAAVTIRWREREKLYQELSNKDGLTRVASRHYFLSRMQTEFSRVQGRHGTLSFIMIDLDHFKKINDSYGHQAGDFVLVEAAKILMHNARNYDEVGRYGGEEFAILLPNTSLNVAEKIAERIRESLAETQMEIDGNNVKVTASLGVASYPDLDIKSVNDLLKKADEALYVAKKSGRNKVVRAQQKLPLSVSG